MTSTGMSRLSYLLRRGYLFVRKGPEFGWYFIRWHARRALRRLQPGRQPWRIELDAFWLQFVLERPWQNRLAEVVTLHDDKAARDLLLRYFGQRNAPRFFFRFENCEQIRQLVPAPERERTLAMADRITGRTFDFRGQDPVVFAGAIDWTHCPQNNVDWMWDLNRLFFLVSLGRAYWYSGRERYAQAFAELASDWLQNNPADERHPNWRNPFEVANRIPSLLWAYFLFLQAGALDPSLHQQLLQALWTHGSYLDECLELHVPNNHLLLQARSLLMLATLFPEFRAARRWRDRSAAILERELGRQVCPDGVHVERVPHYHRLIAGELLELLVLFENNQIEPSPRLQQAFAGMITFERHISRPDNKIPLFGDSSHDDPHVRFNPLPGAAALLQRSDWKTGPLQPDEMTIWLLGAGRVESLLALPSEPPDPSRIFSDGGYAIMRDRWDGQGGYLVMDCGPFGYPLATGHGHADALSLQLYAAGRELLVDAGAYSFHLGSDWRYRFRATRAHNTVVVDDCDQSLLLDDWRVWQPARTTIIDWVSQPDLVLVVACHDGYHRLPHGVTHWRSVLFIKPEYWLVIDYLQGTGEHTYELLFHLPADCSPQLDASTKAVLTPELAIVPLNGPGASVQLSQAWISPRSGVKEKAPLVSYRQQGPAPAVFQTLLYPLSPEAEAPPSVVALEQQTPADVDPDDRPSALSITTGEKTDMLIIDNRSLCRAKTVGRHQTDAAFSLLRIHDGQLPAKLLLHNGSYYHLDGVTLLREPRNSAFAEVSW